MINILPLSIVICTYRRFNLIQLAVESLCNQIAPKDQFEVIIVDNDTFANKEIIDIVDNAKGIIIVKYVHEPLIGLSQARNTGGKVALGEYVGYMDDDAKADKKYVQILLQLIEKTHYDIIGGPYYAFYLTQKPIWFQDKYESRSSGDTHLFQKNEFLNGTNMVYRKTILEEAKWFNVSCGMSGKQIAYGEETDLQMRVWHIKESLKVFYCKDLIVYHLVQQNKMKIMDRLLRSYKMGVSQAYLWIPNESILLSQKNAPLALLKTFICLVFKVIPQLFFRDKIKYPYWQNYTYEVIGKYIRGIGQEWRFTRDLFLKRKN
jgi:glucosyl-dolichyl phosphate glucuronosyltransferase